MIEEEKKGNDEQNHTGLTMDIEKLSIGADEEMDNGDALITA